MLSTITATPAPMRKLEGLKFGHEEELAGGGALVLDPSNDGNNNAMFPVSDGQEAGGVSCCVGEQSDEVIEPVFHLTTFFELCDELLKDGWDVKLNLEKLKQQVGSDAPIFYNLLMARENGECRLFPFHKEYSDELDKALMEINKHIPETELADCIERLHHKEILESAPPQVSRFLDLARDSTKWNEVAERCGNHLEVIRVQRVYNEFVLDQYESYKRRLAKKPHFQGVNERFLFHGTAKTDPHLVCLSSEGFDPRLARHGNYGCGTYFSTTPNYSAKHYSYSPYNRYDEKDSSNLPRQMVLARVACGRVCDMRNTINQSLTRPPPIFPHDPYNLYDCVQGGPFSSRSSEMHMVVTYDKAQAMPDFLITFRFRSTFEEANRPVPRVQRMLRKLNRYYQRANRFMSPHKQQLQEQQDLAMLLALPITPTMINIFEEARVTAQSTSTSTSMKEEDDGDRKNQDSRQSLQRKRKKGLTVRSKSELPPAMAIQAMMEEQEDEHQTGLFGEAILLQSPTSGSRKRRILSRPKSERIISPSKFFDDDDEEDEHQYENTKQPKYHTV